MSHLAFHFIAGWLTGTAIALIPLGQAWSAGSPLAKPFRTWLLLSWGLGVYACVPSLLEKVGCRPAVCGSRWMNVFLFHPLIRHHRLGGSIVGPAGLACCFALQYSLLLLAIRRRSRPDRARGESDR